jgi:hypothetical protein
MKRVRREIITLILVSLCLAEPILANKKCKVDKCAICPDKKKYTCKSCEDGYYLRTFFSKEKGANYNDCWSWWKLILGLLAILLSAILSCCCCWWLFNKGKQKSIKSLERRKEIIQRRQKARERERKREKDRREAEAEPVETERSLIREVKPITIYKEPPLRTTVHPVSYVSRTPVKVQETVINQPTLQEHSRLSKMPYVSPVRPVHVMTGTYQPTNGYPVIKTSTEVYQGNGPQAPPRRVVLSPSKIVHPSTFSSPQPKVITNYTPVRQPQSSITFRNRAHLGTVYSPRATYYTPNEPLSSTAAPIKPLDQFTSSLQKMSNTPVHTRKLVPRGYQSPAQEYERHLSSPVAPSESMRATYEPQQTTTPTEPRRAGNVNEQMPQSFPSDPSIITSPTRPVLQPQNMDKDVHLSKSPFHSKKSLAPHLHHQPSFPPSRHPSRIPGRFQNFPSESGEVFTTESARIQKKVSSPKISYIDTSKSPHKTLRRSKPMMVQDTVIIEDREITSLSGKKPKLMKRRTVTTHQDMVEMSADKVRIRGSNWKQHGKAYSVPQDGNVIFH